MAKYIITTTGEALAKDLIASLGATTTEIGDRVSDYFELARGSEGDTSVSVSLIENVHGLDGEEPYYGVHIIDDISSKDCFMRYTKTLNRNELISLLDTIIKSLPNSDTDAESPDPRKDLLFWANYEYEDAPLAFVKLDTVLPSDSMVKILRLFDRWYGNTDQDAPVWATEYQLLARMLLTSNAMLINPKYLDMSDLDQDYETMLFALGDRNAKKYEAALAITAEELAGIYQMEEA